MHRAISCIWASLSIRQSELVASESNFWMPYQGGKLLVYIVSVCVEFVRHPNVLVSCEQHAPVCKDQMAQTELTIHLASGDAHYPDPTCNMCLWKGYRLFLTLHSQPLLGVLRGRMQKATCTHKPTSVCTDCLCWIGAIIFLFEGMRLGKRQHHNIPKLFCSKWALSCIHDPFVTTYIYYSHSL